MRYADYKTKKAKLDATEREYYEKLGAGALRTEQHELRVAAARQWNLGTTRYADKVDPGTRTGIAAVVSFDGETMQINTYFMDREEVGSVHHIGASIASPLTLTAQQWHLVAQIVAHIDTWRSGELDELKPSGEWRDQLEVL